MTHRHDPARFAAALLAHGANNTRAVLHLTHQPAGDRPAASRAGSRTLRHPLVARCLVRTAAKDIGAARALIRALADGRRSERLKAAIRHVMATRPELANFIRYAELRPPDRTPKATYAALAAGRRREAKRDPKARKRELALRERRRLKIAKRRSADNQSDDLTQNSGGNPPKTPPALRPGSHQGNGKATSTPKRTTS